MITFQLDELLMCEIPTSQSVRALRHRARFAYVDVFEVGKACSETRMKIHGSRCKVSVVGYCRVIFLCSRLERSRMVQCAAEQVVNHEQQGTCPEWRATGTNVRSTIPDPEEADGVKITRPASAHSHFRGRPFHSLV
jgi:hypothetical protein